jgi:hypothetical protein
MSLRTDHNRRHDLLRKALLVYLALLVPIAWLVTRFSPYNVDGDAVAYMDLSTLMLHHRWAGVVNGYWHPLYPALLALGHLVAHPTRANELGVYYTVNFVIFLAEVASMLAFASALDRLRTRMAVPGATPLLSLNALRLLGLGLLVVATQRELGFDKVRPDALLQALMLSAFAMLMFALASESLVYAPLMGLFLGLAYLTKSFAFVAAILSIAVLVAFKAFIQRRSLTRALTGGALAAIVFATIAGPYMVALSHQKHRLDFGDSGALNYAWYASGTEKLHLEPNQSQRYGTADVDLIHPDQPLLSSPAIFSYRAEPYGTYPDWFDPTFFNERITPHLNLPVLIHRDLRNAILIVRYLFNHPEAWVLFALLLVLGVRFRFGNWRRNGFWLPMLLLGVAIFAIYGLVNIEERYVTLAYLAILLPLFATLSPPAQPTERDPPLGLPRVASAMILLLAFTSLGQMLRIALQTRRLLAGLPHTWYSPEIFGAAHSLATLGVQPGDQIACMGTRACVYDHYWARLARVRILTEVYNSNSTDLFSEWSALANRPQVQAILNAQQAKVLVAYFDPADLPSTASSPTPAVLGWRRLGTTNFYALPLNLTPPPAMPEPPRAWSEDNLGP